MPRFYNIHSRHLCHYKCINNQLCLYMKYDPSNIIRNSKKNKLQQQQKIFKTAGELEVFSFFECLCKMKNLKWCNFTSFISWMERVYIHVMIDNYVYWKGDNAITYILTTVQKTLGKERQHLKNNSYCSNKWTEINDEYY